MGSRVAAKPEVTGIEQNVAITTLIKQLISGTASSWLDGILRPYF
jgi:hypothetical protein